MCIDCVPGYFSSKEKQPFCLDCDAGKYQKLGGAKECISCDPGFYNPDKRSTASCKRCIVEGETANDEGTGCIKVNVNPNAAVITIKDLRVASEDGRRVQIIFTLSSGVTATSTIEATDRLELSVSPRTDFKKDTSYILYDLKEIANNNKDPVDFTVIVEPIESNKDDIYDEITGLGSVWEIQRYFRAKIYKIEGESVTFGADSVRNDMWDTATKCGNELYLRTHPDDDLTATPFPLKSLTERGDDTPSCIPCPKGANCRGPRTWAQVVSLPGYRPLPWDDRGYGACPRPLACPGNEENYLPPEDTFLLDGGNSTRTAAECYPSHRSMLCSECNHFFDTKLGDQLGLCVACPDATQNYLRLSGLFVVGVLMMSFLVHDTLHGVKKIGELFAFSLLVLLFLCSYSSLVLSSLTTCFVLFGFFFSAVAGIAEGKDAAMPFHSIGIRIISSFMQIAGLLNNFRLDLPEAVTGMFTAQSAVSGVGGAVISFNCLLPETRGSELFMYRLLTIVVLIPVAAVIFVCLFWSFYAGVLHKDKEPVITVHGHAYKHPRPKDKMIGTMVVLFYLMFPSILS